MYIYICCVYLYIHMCREREIERERGCNILRMFISTLKLERRESLPHIADVCFNVEIKVRNMLQALFNCYVYMYICYKLYLI